MPGYRPKQKRVWSTAATPTIPASKPHSTSSTASRARSADDGRVKARRGRRIEFHLIVLSTSEFPRALELWSWRRSGADPALAEHTRGPHPHCNQSRRAAACCAAGAPRAPTSRRGPARTAARGTLQQPDLRDPAGLAHLQGLARHHRHSERTLLGLRSRPQQPHRYQQRATGDFSNADCIQMIVYHQLNETDCRRAEGSRLPFRTGGSGGARCVRRRRAFPMTSSWRATTMHCGQSAQRGRHCEKGGELAAPKRSGLHRRSATPSSRYCGSGTQSAIDR